MFCLTLFEGSSGESGNNFNKSLSIQYVQHFVEIHTNSTCSKDRLTSAFIRLCVHFCSSVLVRSFLNSCQRFPLGAVWSLMSGDSPFSGCDSFLMPLVIWNSFNCTKLPLHLEWRSAFPFSSYFQNLSWSDWSNLMVIFCPIWSPRRHFTVAVCLHTHQPTALSAKAKSLDLSSQLSKTGI